MDKKDCGMLMDKIFANLYNAIIPSSLDESVHPTKLLNLVIPGITIDNSLDPATLKGKTALYQLADSIPAVAKNYVDSTRKVSFEYEKILGAIAPEDDPNAKKLEAQYQEAQALLFKDGAYTATYNQYVRLQAAFNEAQNAYYTEKNKVNANETVVNKLEQAMKMAMNNWIVAGKAKIEQALAILTKYRAFTPASVFSEAIIEFNCAASSAGYPVTFVPASWSSKPEELSWQTVMVMEGTESDHVHKDISSVSSSFSAGFSAGLWGGSASGSYKKDLEHIQTESKVDKFGMKFEVARVDLIRSWFNGGLLGYPNVYINGVKIDGICNGSLQNTDGCTLPIMPTAFIVARNINVYNDYSDTEQNYIKQATDWSAHAKVSYGPFSLGNDTSCSDLSEDDKKDGFKASAKITVGAKPQIIGIISTIMSPGFPQMAAPAAADAVKAPLPGKDRPINKLEQMITGAINNKIGLPS